MRPAPLAARLFALSIVGAALRILAGCAEEERPIPPVAATSQQRDAGLPALTSEGIRDCSQARAGTPLPQRLIAQSADAGAAQQVVLASDLFDLFNNVCKPCHTAAADPPGQGGFQIVQASDFTTLMTPSVIQHVTASVCPSTAAAGSANDPMPPCDSDEGHTYATRPDSDPVKQFAVLVNEWLALGSPASFTPTSSGSGTSSGNATPQFTMTPAIANAMTDIGNCVPSKGLIGIEDQRSAQLDAMFASAKSNPNGSPQEVIGLPQLLSQTDLFTLDSATLAQYGVVSYAPAYPLWTDDAGKLRFVRVPRGQSIRFDKATQQFIIPANTRFYKTFMKQIVDTDGSYRYRKIETRLIVSRPDTNNPDGTAASQNALFGTYLWNDNETDATLAENPLNDGKPFSDSVFLYNTDEPLAADVLASAPANPELQLLNYGAARHYAIPSSQRCIQCHMGSPSQSFVLGFTPLQVNRREVGAGGIIQPVGPDELTQLQRFIDAGIITGIDSPSDVLPLESSQGSRKPRNDYELKAQGYMLGNCAHCHNPRGYPSVQNANLKNLLSFLPAAGSLGGIFQFSLETYSPRIFRGPSASEPIPYITPSLVDLPKTDPSDGSQEADWFVKPVVIPGDQVYWIDYAPWRSLIYRNADSAFAYVDDVAVFPHMPMNGVGYDPRAKQLLGDWMVSIPAIRKRPDIAEYSYQVSENAYENLGSEVVDTSPQPYVEVKPGSPQYAQAVNDANARLQIWHTGINPAIPATEPYSRYLDPGQTDDILDPAVVQDPVCHPVPVANANLYSNPLPEHPHWVITDLTSPPGPWTPRQPNWPDVLVEQTLPTAAGLGGACAPPTAVLNALDDQIDAIEMLPDAYLDDVRAYATAAQPFGLWQQQPGCNFSSQPTVGSFTGSSRPHWMDVTNPPANAPVYTQTPGQSIFKMICINCHGPDGAADGRMAQNLATMTGGNALVADFRDGLFGPLGSTVATSYRQNVFSGLPSGASSSWTGSSIDDRAARYMAWMGLGGTSVNIPIEILEIVAVTSVLGQQRVLSETGLSANMLSQAKTLCRSLIGPDTGKGQFYFGSGLGYMDISVEKENNPHLIWENGDAELWLHLCSMANPPPIHVFELDQDSVETSVDPIVDADFNYSIQVGDYFPSSEYPTATPVGNQNGGTDPSLTTANLWPWCIDDSKASPAQQATIVSHLPVCPQVIMSQRSTCINQPTLPCQSLNADDINRWAVRGAVNAGMSVFLYLENLYQNLDANPPPDYNQCSLLK